MKFCDINHHIQMRIGFILYDKGAVQFLYALSFLILNVWCGSDIDLHR